MDAAEIDRIYVRFSKGGNLAQSFQERFGQPLEEDTLNQSHQSVIVASSLDASSERIVGYLNHRDIAINVLCFQVFETEHGLLLSRAWLHDPIETQVAAAGGGGSAKEPWNGEYYASFGEGADRSWNEAMKHGFICAGGGTWYSGTLNMLKPGDRVWAKVPATGFVGVGRVREAAVPAAEFELRDVEGTLRPALEVLEERAYHRKFVDDSEKCEYFVAVQWAHTVPLNEAFNEVGLFGN